MNHSSSALPGQSKLLGVLSDDTNRGQALELARALDVPLLADIESGSDALVLEFCGSRLVLHPGRRSGYRPWELALGGRYQGKGKDPLRRAIGSGVQHVVDATAGWCTDAVQIAGRGIRVTAIERCPAVVAIVTHALDSLADRDLASRIELVQGESREVLTRLTPDVDVVYMDPLYPEKRKTAATRKELVLLRQLAGRADTAGNEETLLLQAARKCAGSRVVVKRPHYALPIASGKVGETRSKLVRFDIYPVMKEVDHT